MEALGIEAQAVRQDQLGRERWWLAVETEAKVDRRRTSPISALTDEEFVSAWNRSGGFGAVVAREYGVTTDTVLKRARRLKLEVKKRGWAGEAMKPSEIELRVLRGEVTQTKAAEALGITRQGMSARVKAYRKRYGTAGIKALLRAAQGEEALDTFGTLRITDGEAKP